MLVDASVSEVNDEVNADDSEIYNVYGKHESHVARIYLSAYTCDVACNDKENKSEAH